MRCPFCGQLLANDAKKCPICGVDIPEGTAAEAEASEVTSETSSEGGTYTGESAGSSETSYQSYENPVQNQKQGMKWYKFLIYVSLILSCITNVYSGIQMMLGLHYGDSVTANMVYQRFGVLKTLDIVAGIAYIAFGVYAFIVRQKLAKYKADGPKALLILYGAGCVIAVAYLLLATVITGINMVDETLIVNIVVSVFMIIVNKIYFTKRAHLFVN